MQFRLSVDELLQLAPKMNVEGVADYILAIERIAPELGIHTPERIAAFLSMVIIESNQFRKGRQQVSIKGWMSQKQAWSVMRIAELPEAKRKQFQFKANAGEFDDKDKELAMFLYGKNKHLGNLTDEDGWTFRGAFFSRRYGRLAIQDCVRHGHELAEECGWDEYLHTDADWEKVCVHPYYNVWSVAQTWSFNEMNRFADNGHLSSILAVTDYPDQVRKMRSLMEQIYTTIFTKSTSSSNV